MIQLSIKATGADLVRQGLEDFTKQVPQIGRLRIYNMMLDVKRILSTPAPKPTYPINWDSDRQRAAFFASDGFGAGIPYQRTGEHESSWQITRLDEGYRIYNDVDSAVYLYGNFEGERQSAIHRGRHPIFQQVVEDKLQDLPQDIENNISYYGRQKGF